MFVVAPDKYVLATPLDRRYEEASKVVAISSHSFFAGASEWDLPARPYQ